MNMYSYFISFLGTETLQIVGVTIQEIPKHSFLIRNIIVDDIVTEQYKALVGFDLVCPEKPKHPCN